MPAPSSALTARAFILSQGDEVVTGQIVDTNAAWLAERLTDVGFDVVGHLAVRDDRAEIQQAVHHAAAAADVVISTGGLGPTEDDLTAEAVAAACGTSLSLDAEALSHIRALYARYGRPMPAVNEKQAWLPSGSERLDNDWGTAPGFALELGGAWMSFLPGVPREMKEMWAHRVLPALRERFELTPARLVTIRTTGVGESNLQERIGTLDEPGVVLSFRTKLPENHIKLRIAATVSAERAHAVVEDLVARIGSPVFAVEGIGSMEGSLASVVAQHLAAAGQTLAVAESCTGGLIAAACTAIPGSSSWFLEGAVTYANEAKVRTLGVSPADLAAHGAVSEAVAIAMAQGMRARAGSTWALSSTGIAGPSGGTEDKPVGTVHVALASEAVTHHRLLRLGGDRHRIQQLTTGAALDLLRRALQHHL